jgi:hypothetical protein
VIQINVHLTEENPTNTTHMLPMPVHIRPVYAFCGWSLYMLIFHESSTELNRVTAHEKRTPDTIHNTPTDRSAGSYLVSLLSQPMKQWRKSNIYQQQATRLTGPYHRHAIGIFNTWSWGPTRRSLIDTGGGYNFEGADFPHTTP